MIPTSKKPDRNLNPFISLGKPENLENHFIKWFGKLNQNDKFYKLKHVAEFPLFLLYTSEPFKEIIRGLFPIFTKK